mgnify:CR=1 FL=1
MLDGLHSRGEKWLKPGLNVYKMNVDACSMENGTEATAVILHVLSRMFGAKEWDDASGSTMAVPKSFLNLIK